jgi:hypothetical protein
VSLRPHPLEAYGLVSALFMEVPRSKHVSLSHIAQRLVEHLQFEAARAASLDAGAAAGAGGASVSSATGGSLSSSAAAATRSASAAAAAPAAARFPPWIGQLEPHHVRLFLTKPGAPWVTKRELVWQGEEGVIDNGAAPAGSRKGGATAGAAAAKGRKGKAGGVGADAPGSAVSASSTDAGSSSGAAGHERSGGAESGAAARPHGAPAVSPGVIDVRGWSVMRVFVEHWASRELPLALSYLLERPRGGIADAGGE